MKKIAFFLIIPVAFSLVALAAKEKESAKGSSENTQPAASEHKILAPSDLQWVDAPPGLPAGAKMAVLDGDPLKKGPFTVRMQAPAGYKIPPHTHPTAERLTVISGTINLGMGDKFDEAATHEMGPGSFAVLPPGMTHFVRTTGESIVQIHSEGPFVIKYVNPADDPRKAKK